MMNTFITIFIRFLPGLLFVWAAVAHLPAQNTLQGEAKIIPEAEVERQALFVDAEKERLLGKYDKAIELYKKFLYDNGNNDAAWFGLARTYYAKSDESNALESAAKAINLAPDNQWYRIFQADIFEKAGKNREALGVYTELVRRFPQAPAFLERQAYLQLMTEEPKSALKTLDQLEKLQGIREKTSYEKHLIYVGLKDYKKAAGVLEELISVFPKEIPYRRRLADFYTSIGDDAAAQKVYSAILEIDPSDSAARLAAVGKPQSGKDVDFLQKLQPLFADPGVSIDAKIKDITPYLVKLRENREPALAEVLVKLGVTVEQTHPKDPKAWALAGDIFYLSGRSSDALQRYRQCIALNANVFSVWENTLRILFEMGQIEELYTMSGRAMDDFPNQPLAYYYFGSAANKKGLPQQAVAPLEQAVLMTGNDPRLRMDIISEIGQSLILQKQYQKAATRLESALLKGGDQHPGILERYGDAQSGLGNKDKALEFWNKAQALQNTPRLEQKINDLKN